MMKLRLRYRPAGRSCLTALVGLPAILSASVASPPVFAGDCKLAKMAELPVTMTNMRPLITAKINDVDVQFVADSGAFYSMMSAASAAQLNLPHRFAPFGLWVTGVGGGTADVTIATVKVFTIAGTPFTMSTSWSAAARSERAASGFSARIFSTSEMSSTILGKASFG